MSSEPRIAIPVPTRTDFEYNRRSWPMYAEAVRNAGGQPIEVALDSSERILLALADECAGVLLPGSPADVDPRLYGRQRIAECSPADPARETVDRLLLEECSRRGKSLLGVCYGAQSLNVWCGGTLVQDLGAGPVNHAAGASVSVAHAIVLVPGSGGEVCLLGSLVDESEATVKGGELRFPVNSSHHQAVEQVGSGLRMCAISAEDGVIEGIERSVRSNLPAFTLGVQWHPERSTATSGTSRAIFRALVEAAITWEQLHLSAKGR